MQRTLVCTKHWRIQTDFHTKPIVIIPVIVKTIIYQFFLQFGISNKQNKSPIKMKSILLATELLLFIVPHFFSLAFCLFIECISFLFDIPKRKY